MNRTEIFFVVAVLTVAVLFTHTGEYNDAVAMDAERVEIEAERKAAPRESWALTHPLSCSGRWVKNCSDFKPCKNYCIEEPQ